MDGSGEFALALSGLTKEMENGLTVKTDKVKLENHPDCFLNGN
jgi:hypothetical protein